MKKFIFITFLTTLLLAGCGTKAPQACTEEAKICPDGSAVGRTGPNCEFAPCPENTTPPNTTQPKACSMIAKLCPDGSSVGRTGPNCEFAPCPNTSGQVK